MKLSRNAERLFEQLRNIDPELLLHYPEYWKKRMGRMSQEKAKAYFDLFEELESEGRIVMTIEEIPGKYTVPKKVRVQEEAQWF